MVDISAKGQEIWGIDRNQTISRYTNDTWIIIPLNTTSGPMVGKPAKVAASPDGWTWMITHHMSEQNVYRFNLNTWMWEKISGTLYQINAVSQDVAIGTAKGEIWRYNANSNSERIPFEGYAIWAAIGEHDDMWVVDSANFLYRWNHAKEAGWTRMPGIEVATVDVQNADSAIMTTRCGRVYVWRNASWVLVPDAHAIRATMSNDAIYYVDEGENVMTGGKDMIAQSG